MELVRNRPKYQERMHLEFSAALVNRRSWVMPNSRNHCIVFSQNLNFVIALSMFLWCLFQDRLTMTDENPKLKPRTITDFFFTLRRMRHRSSTSACRICMYKEDCPSYSSQALDCWVPLGKEIPGRQATFRTACKGDLWRKSQCCGSDHKGRSTSDHAQDSEHSGG